MENKEFELKSKFTEEFFNEFQFDADFRTLFNCMVKGMTPYEAIEYLFESKKALFKSLVEVVQNNPMRIVVTADRFKELEDELK